MKPLLDMIADVSGHCGCAYAWVKAGGDCVEIGIMQLLSARARLDQAIKLALAEMEVRDEPM